MSGFDLWKLGLTGFLAVLGPAAASAESYTITIARPKPPVIEGFKMGQARRPDGASLTLDSNSLLLDGKRWTPVMGEFHFSRYPENEWREELLKMKAGGVDIVSTYVFWIHHEEIEGQFDWSGSRSLRQFIQLCQEAGLKAFVRCGPWDHGEVRNGGFPDWLLKKGWKTRGNDTNYLAKARILYGEIARQLDGLLWKDGGPVIGIQFENEYSGPAEHLLTLKRIGREMGLDAPIYTRTGWNQPSGHMPFGEVVPLYGVYAEGFWDRVLTPMPAGYWKGFRFSNFRMDDANASELPGEGGAVDSPDAAQYPFLTCEIGGGMMNSYHRRILVNPKDIESTTLIKLGSGSTLPGYYMYHGGVNPEGKLTTLMESQATGYWNDMPVKNYDFQAPLGQYGQIRQQYHLLRRLHLFLHEWGSELAGMPATMPDQRPHGKNDFDTLRWSVRSDGQSGFVFVDNYQRLQDMPPKKDVQFVIHLPSGPLIFPQTPVTIPSGACLIWPFNLDLGQGVRLAWATAQPLTAVDDGNARTVFFAETEGVPAQFAFAPNGPPLEVISGHPSRSKDASVIRDIMPGTGVAARFLLAGGRSLQIVVLDTKDSLALWKGDLQGRDRVFLTDAGLVLDGDSLRLTSTNPGDLSVAIYPAPSSLESQSMKLEAQTEGVFGRYAPSAPRAVNLKAAVKKVQDAGPPREIPIGKIEQPVATAPLDPDFEKAAVWRVKIPADIDLGMDPILRFHYVGDVARVMLDGRFITDDFYNGNEFDLGLRRHAPDITGGDLRIAVLPLRKDAPIYMAGEMRPDFGASASVADLQRVEIIPRYQLQLRAGSKAGSPGRISQR
ncbi:MAG: beta-galactosidase [Limisphaerales bacterium]